MQWQSDSLAMYVIVWHIITSIVLEGSKKVRTHSAPAKIKIAQVGSEKLNFCVVVTHDKNRQQQKYSARKTYLPTHPPMLLCHFESVNVHWNYVLIGKFSKGKTPRQFNLRAACTPNRSMSVHNDSARMAQNSNWIPSDYVIPQYPEFKMTLVWC